MSVTGLACLVLSRDLRAGGAGHQKGQGAPQEEGKARQETRQEGKESEGPGIPGQWPFKQDLLKELEWEKQRAAAEQKRKKEERRLAQVSAIKS